MPIDQLVQNFGLPIGLLLWFIYQNYKTAKEYNEYIKDIASKAINALDSNTKSLQDNNAIMERVEKKLNEG